MSTDNVSQFPMSTDSFQRAILGVAEKYVANALPPFDAEKQLWDNVIQAGLMRGLPIEGVIQEADKIITARRAFFKSEK